MSAIEEARKNIGNNKKHIRIIESMPKNTGKLLEVKKAMEEVCNKIKKQNGWK